MECSICREDIVGDNPVVSTSCGHVFHRECLERWWKTGHRTTCPDCRTPCQRSEVRQLYISISSRIHGVQHVDDATGQAEGTTGDARPAMDGDSLQQHAKIKALLASLDKSRAEIEECYDQIESLTQENVCVRDRLTDQQRELRRAEKSASELQQALKFAKKESQSLEEERKKLDRRLRAKEAESINYKVMTDYSLDEEMLRNLMLKGKGGPELKSLIANNVKTIAKRNKEYKRLLNEFENAKIEFDKQISADRVKLQQTTKNYENIISERGKELDVLRRTVESMHTQRSLQSLALPMTTTAQFTTVEMDKANTNLDDRTKIQQESAVQKQPFDQTENCETGNLQNDTRNHHIRNRLQTELIEHTTLPEQGCNNRKGATFSSGLFGDSIENKENRKENFVIGNNFQSPETIDGYRVRSDDKRSRQFAAATFCQSGTVKDPVRSSGRTAVSLEVPNGRGGLKRVLVDKNNIQNRSLSNAAEVQGKKPKLVPSKRPVKPEEHTSMRSDGLRIEHFFDLQSSSI